MTKTAEPLHVTFARVVMGERTEWLPCSHHSKGGWWAFREGLEVHDYTKDRAFCQELAEWNFLSVAPSGPGGLWLAWSAFGSDAASKIEPMESGTWCEAVLRWAIAATEAGVPVRLPGGEKCRQKRSQRTFVNMRAGAST